MSSAGGTANTGNYVPVSPRTPAGSYFDHGRRTISGDRKSADAAVAMRGPPTRNENCALSAVSCGPALLQRRGLCGARCAPGAEGEWGATQVSLPPLSSNSPATTTIVPRSGGEDQGAATEGTPVRLVALLTSDGQHIDQGLIWRVFETGTHNEGKTALVETSRDCEPRPEGQGGRLSRQCCVRRVRTSTRSHHRRARPRRTAVEHSVINAGGLRITVPSSPVITGTGQHRDLQHLPDRDQSDNRNGGPEQRQARAGHPFNAGIYQHHLHLRRAVTPRSRAT